MFVHIPKAAGVAVAQALYGNLAAGHMTIQNYQEFFRQRAMEQMFVFTFVRNPWDRVFSAYKFLKLGGWPKFDRAYSEKYLLNCKNFEEFVQDVLPIEDARDYVHFRPCLHFLKARDGEVYPFSFVGRFENFERDFDTVRRAVRPDATLKHLNSTASSSRAIYLDAYTPQMIDIVQSLYGESIDALGYTFDGHSASVPCMDGRVNGE